MLRGPQSPQFVAMVDRPNWRELGFAGGGAGSFWFLSVPFWFLLAATAAPPGLWLILRGRRRKGSGRCPKCGYDLRASPDRCPECGTMAAVTSDPAPTPAP